MQQAERSRLIRIGSSVSGRQTKGHCCLIAAIVLVSAGWMASSAAHATCSHLVATRADAARLKLAQMDRLILGSTRSGDLQDNLPPGRPTVPRCHGFLCSGNSMPILPLPAPQVVPRIDAWSRLGLRSLTRNLPSSRLWHDETSPHSVDQVEPFPRPPR